MKKSDNYHTQEVFQAVSTNILYGTIPGNNSLSNNITDFLSISKTPWEILCQTAGISPRESVLPSLFYVLVKNTPYEIKCEIILFPLKELLPEWNSLFGFGTLYGALTDSGLCIPGQSN